MLYILSYEVHVIQTHTHTHTHTHTYIYIYIYIYNNINTTDKGIDSYR